MNEAAGSPGASGRPEPGILFALCVVPVAVHLAGLANASYGYFIDEFYYIACAKRLAFGYVDHPPLAPGLLAITRLVFGESVLAIRILPVLAAGATVWITGLLVARLGDGHLERASRSVAVGRRRGSHPPGAPQRGLADPEVDDVARVHESLPLEDRRRALVYVPSYGHAGALELLGPARGLPPVIASQNTYWHWSVGRLDHSSGPAIPGSLARSCHALCTRSISAMDGCLWTPGG